MHHLPTIITTTLISRNNFSIPTISQQEANLHVAFYGVIAFFAVLGNIPVLIIICRTPALQTKSNLFLANLAVSDIMTGAVKDVFIMIGMQPRRWIYSDTLCQISGFFIGVFHSVTVITLMVIAIFRYLIVVHGRRVNLKKRHVWIAIVLIWIFAILDALLPIIGWSKYAYSLLEFGCLPEFDPRPPSYALFLLLAVTLIPLSIITYCYIAILVNIFIHDGMLRRYINHNGRQRQDLRCQLRQRELRATRRMFVVYMAFIVCLLPWAIIMLILVPAGILISLKSIFWIGFLVNMNSAINPLIYYMIYPKIRRGYKKLICGHRRLESEVTSIRTTRTKVMSAWS